LAASNCHEGDGWVDYARGLGGAEERAAMEAHLSSGCEQCQRQAALWGRLAATARAEAEYEPSPHTVRLARAIFALRAPERARSPVQILARLVYDSFRDPLPAGLRAADRPSQARFEAEHYSVDLHLNRERVDREIGAGRMVLVGQIEHSSQPGKGLADLPVLLVSGSQVVARGVSNERGEFHLEYDPRTRPRLRIPVEVDKRIEIRLPQSNQWGTI
jgi:hypothetical protein